MGGESKDLEKQRSQLLEVAVRALEGALPPGTPPRGAGERHLWDVVVDGLETSDLRPALRSIAAGPGGELKPTSRGNIAMCSAESSALMALNFFAPFRSRAGLLGQPVGDLSMECELRVSGVRSRVGPTLDLVHSSDAGAVAIEAKTAEPWREPPKVSLSKQYDEPAAAVSPQCAQVLAALRDGDLAYHCLDATQLIKHLLGIHSALAAGILTAPARLTLFYWCPTEAGDFADLFELLHAEAEGFAAALDDQPVSIAAIPSSRVLDEWSDSQAPQWLREHERVLRARYDPPLISGR